MKEKRLIARIGQRFAVNQESGEIERWFGFQEFDGLKNPIRNLPVVKKNADAQTLFGRPEVAPQRCVDYRRGQWGHLFKSVR
jgi:hypothetical protein